MISELVSNAAPVKDISVKAMAGKKIGSVIGKRRIGNKPPLTVAEVVKAAVKVPAAANPINPKKIVAINSKKFSVGASNRIKNIGKIKIDSATSDKKT